MKLCCRLLTCPHGRRRTCCSRARRWAHSALLSGHPSQPKACRSVRASGSPTISPAQDEERSTRTGREALGQTARERCSPSHSLPSSTDPSQPGSHTTHTSPSQPPSTLPTHSSDPQTPFRIPCLPTCPAPFSSLPPALRPPSLTHPPPASSPSLCAAPAVPSAPVPPLPTLWKP